MSHKMLAFMILFHLSIIIPIFVVGIYQGKKKCYNNDAMGVLILFIFLNIIGLIWGLAILYNYRHNVNINKKKEYEKNITIAKPNQNNISP